MATNFGDLLVTRNPVSISILKYLDASDLANISRLCSTSYTHLQRHIVYQLWNRSWPIEIDLYFELAGFSVSTDGVYYANIRKLLLPSCAEYIIKTVCIPYNLITQLAEGATMVNYLNWELCDVGLCAFPLREGEDVCWRLNKIYPCGTLFVVRASLKLLSKNSIECECVKLHFMKSIKRQPDFEVVPPFYIGEPIVGDCGGHILCYRPQTEYFLNFSGLGGANLRFDEPQAVDQQSLNVLLNGPRIHYDEVKDENTITITEKLYREGYGFISGLIEAYSRYEPDIVVNRTPLKVFRNYTSFSTQSEACRIFHMADGYKSFICKDQTNKPDNIIFSICLKYKPYRSPF